MQDMKRLLILSFMLVGLVLAWCFFDAVYCATQHNVAQTIFNAVLVVINGFSLRSLIHSWQRAKQYDD